MKNYLVFIYELTFFIIVSVPLAIMLYLGTTILSKIKKLIIMAYSTCCGAYSTMPEIDICPECLEHCDFEDLEDEANKTLINNQNQ